MRTGKDPGQSSGLQRKINHFLPSHALAQDFVPDPNASVLNWTLPSTLTDLPSRHQASSTSSEPCLSCLPLPCPSLTDQFPVYLTLFLSNLSGPLCLSEIPGCLSHGMDTALISDLIQGLGTLKRNWALSGLDSYPREKSRHLSWSSGEESCLA